MKREDFIQEMGRFLSSPEKAAGLWILFAEENVSKEQFAGCERIGNDEAEVEHWLDCTMEELSRIQKEYGQEKAQEIAALSLQKKCLYPLEMQEYAAGVETETGKTKNMKNLAFLWNEERAAADTKFDRRQVLWYGIQ